MTEQKKKQEQIPFQKWIAGFGIVLFIGKIIAWKLTGSDAVFSDAMESIVNIISAFLGLYSLYLAAKPSDEGHPYGHGKVEFVTSAIEGALISIAGIIIIYEGANSLITGKILNKLDWGIWIIAGTAIINYLLGYLSIKRGKKVNSLVLISSGKHLQSDTITTLGVIVSLGLVYFTHLNWIDAVVALLFGFYIIVIGYKIIRKSLSGIMDEANPEMLNQIAELLEKNRKKDWIDIHNMKIQQFGSRLHLDAHLTLPWYFNLRTAHNDMEEVVKLIAKNTERYIEFNFHMDDCKSTSCAICQVENCSFRETVFTKKIKWNGENISHPNKHTIEN